jgi:hypothetical protein
MHQRIAGCALAVLTAAALGVPARARAQGTFEGMVAGTMSVSDGKVVPFRYYQLGSRTRQEYTYEGHGGAMIFDGTTGDMISIMPEQKKYMVMNLRTASGPMRKLGDAMGGGRGDKAPDFSKMKVTRTGQHETIAGIPCEHYLFQNTEEPDTQPIDMCGATGLGFMGMAGQNSSMMPSTAALLRSQNPDLARLARQGFFPLKMTFSERQHPDRKSVWVVTQIDRHRPDAALFQPPAGYTQLQIPGMGKP